MNDNDFVLTTLWNDYLKLAKVNAQTGEYQFVRIMEVEEQFGCLDTTNIEDYVQCIVDNNLIHPHDVDGYLYHSSLEYLQNRIRRGERKIMYFFRRKIDDEFIWITIEVIIPEDISDQNPWVVYCWKRTDSTTYALEDSLRMLSTIYHKILKINLTKDTYEEIEVYDNELTKEYGYSPQMSQWVRGIAKAGMIHEEDLEEYLAFMEIHFLREHFRNSSECIRCRHRRLTDGEFHWVSMELLPSIEYTDDNQVIMLYIRDIHDSYIEGMQHKKELEYYCNKDTLTGCWNRFYYTHFCTEFKDRKHKGSGFGLLFADINGLKYTNDHYGYERGDALIRGFAQLLTGSFGTRGCCRISGDEFVVLFENMSEFEVKQQVEIFDALLQQQEVPMAAIGYAWELKPNNINDLMKKAETAMYMDKQNFYKKIRNI